jgi:hypothetical protein
MTHRPGLALIWVNPARTGRGNDVKSDRMAGQRPQYMPHEKQAFRAELRHQLYEILEHGSLAGRAGQVVIRLIVLLIVINLAAVTLESVPSLASTRPHSAASATKSSRRGAISLPRSWRKSKTSSQ